MLCTVDVVCSLTEEPLSVRLLQTKLLNSTPALIFGGVHPVNRPQTCAPPVLSCWTTSGPSKQGCRRTFVAPEAVKPEWDVRARNGIACYIVSDGNCHVIQGGPSAEQRCSEDKVWRRLRFCHPSRASMRWTHSLAVAPPPANEGVGLGCTGLSLILAVKDGLGSFNFVSIPRVCGTHALGVGNRRWTHEAFCAATNHQSGTHAVVRKGKKNSAPTHTDEDANIATEQAYGVFSPIVCVCC